VSSRRSPSVFKTEPHCLQDGARLSSRRSSTVFKTLSDCLQDERSRGDRGASFLRPSASPREQGLCPIAREPLPREWSQRRPIRSPASDARPRRPKTLRPRHPAAVPWNSCTTSDRAPAIPTWPAFVCVHLTDIRRGWSFLSSRLRGFARDRCSREAAKTRSADPLSFVGWDRVSSARQIKYPVNSSRK
jgi:hypothetical protein